MRRLAIIPSLFAAFVLAQLQPTQAQEIAIGLGYGDFHAEQADSGAFVSLEYLGARNWDLFGFDAGPGISGQAHQAGDSFVGLGIQGQRALKGDWFVEVSIMPGLFSEGTPGNDLGSTIEIRSLVGLGRRLRDGHRISLALSHISNASISERNPGLNAISLRLHTPL
ncbi:acyloxyacyl hydrolase [Phaeobacter sp. B1627]|uniref:acyloxyacyl hydrolase n=1 Tax=Phaeobacter sp. B1627 TaxID=2583809 RepID=UPI0011181C40|nr:acyloxyacyl hydrolase [Phaeobacter sp. B1627]TNJ39962.1 acyloxyacyl hydrolase [Phaeobacter sp. B1627]